MSNFLFFIGRVFRAILRRILNFWSLLKWRFFLKSIGSSSYINNNVRFMYPENVTVGNNCLIDVGASFSSEIKSGVLNIRDNVRINRNVTIDFSGNIDIDDGVLISSGTIIFSHSHGYNPLSTPKAKPLKICKNVWIGANVIICENVNKIGPNSLIAAGSVVTKDVMVNSIYGGNPALFIKQK